MTNQHFDDQLPGKLPGQLSGHSGQVGPSPNGWAEDNDGLFDELSPSYPPDSLVTFRFLRDAVVRHARIWLALALVGFVGGLASYLALPAPHQAAARLLITTREGDDPVKAMATEISLATTRTVAERVITLLKLPESPDDLLKQYSATKLTDRVLEIQASAKTDEEATKLATMVAQTYLIFRREQLGLDDAPLRKDLTAAQNEVTVARQAVVDAGDNPDNPAHPSSPEMAKLNAAGDKVRFVQQQLLDQSVSASKMNASRMLDVPGPVIVSAKRAIVLKAGTGLVGGLFLGIGFVIVRALISDRLWKRQDIANALGARVRLSTGRPPRKWLPFTQQVRPAQAPHREIRLLSQHLGQRISWSSLPTPALAVVSVDDVPSCALAVAALAVRLADEGNQVLVADLTSTGVLAKKLGVKEQGTHTSQLSEPGRRIDVYLSDPSGLPAEGCYNSRPNGSGDPELDAAWESADLVLSLATLTPAIGADHLSSWAAQAAVVVTAGRSTAAKVRATGEMLRLAGLEIDTAIVLNADRTDEGVGVTDAEAAATTVDLEMFSR
ncbi:hypothetical protein [Kribbella solani]|uniref:Capsular polysaccharide biosynthesis protein n=1 Tax=Kribbella solani TaxID=236067 RepID=A0A841DN95_9ACTN|nr:hypothetical protein [Kribbella solani]MBB5979229.1 capsular polysaccharide biosynthesis protein [Kribbella solani]